MKCKCCKKNINDIICPFCEYNNSFVMITITENSILSDICYYCGGKADMIETWSIKFSSASKNEKPEFLKDLKIDHNIQICNMCTKKEKTLIQKFINKKLIMSVNKIFADNVK